MFKRDSYHTKQKDQILETVKGLNQEFTIKELYKSLEEKVGLTTILSISR